MKKALLTILAGLPALAFAQTTYTIKAKVGTIGAPSKVFLTYRADDKTITDSTVAVNGAFTFSGTVKDITAATLIYDPTGNGLANLDRKVKRDVAQVYLAQGITTITSADSLSKAKITGTTVNEDNAAYKAFIKPATDKMAKLNAEYSAASPETRKTKEFSDAIDKKEEAIDKEQTELTKQYIKAHPNAYISLVALNSAGGAYAEYADISPLYNLLSPELKATTAGQKWAVRLEKLKHVALGATAPEFAQADTAGKMVSLSSFRGKYLLIDFWASWCGPCRAENPNVVKAFNKYKDKNFTILGVSLDQPGAKDKWMAAIKKDGLNWTQVSDLKFWNNEASTAYGVQAIPQNYLLDPSGKIIGKNLRGEDLENKLAELFGKI
jgi:peroxiredoxin